MSGTDSDVAGTSSAISSMNMENARNTDNPKLIFSPEIIEINVVVGNRWSVIRTRLICNLSKSHDYSILFQTSCASVFVPEVVGSQNVSRVNTDNITHGTIMLKT